MHLVPLALHAGKPGYLRDPFMMRWHLHWKCQNRFYDVLSFCVHFTQFQSSHEPSIVATQYSKHNNSRHRKYQLLAHIYGRALWWCMVDGRNLSRWLTFSYIVYTAQDVFGLPSVFLVCFVSSNVRVTNKFILYLTDCKYNFPLIFCWQK